MTARAPSSTGDGMRIPLSRPEIDEADREAVLEVMRTDRLSLGPVTRRFEEWLARRSGTDYAVAVSSGTAALHLAVRGLGIGPGDEVITTPFSFVASSNCILYEGARPVFVDVEPDTLNIDPAGVRDAIGERTRAILAVDIFGHPAEWDELKALADEFDLALIEDSAEALGSRYRGRAAGGLGEVGIFGFYPNKQITTGEGGALVTDDPELARLARSLSNHGREEDPDTWVEHPRLGYNYRLSEIAAALGLAQLRKLDDLIERRHRVASWYAERLAHLDDVVAPSVRDHVELSWFAYVVRLKEGYSRTDRDRVRDDLQARGIGCRNYFPLIHLQPFYRERLGHGEGDFPTAESAAERTLALPFFAGMDEGQVEEVVKTLAEVLDRP